MKPWIHAWILGTISGLSLPIGAVLGIIFTPVRDEVCAAWMALGAGALLFAVTVELYGHALRELELGRAGLFELFATVAGALLGAFFYLAVNRWLERMMEEGLEDLETASSQSPNESSPLMPGQSKWSVSSALAQERRTWEQSHGSISTPHGPRSLRDESFSRLSSFTPSVGDPAVRGRDRVIHRITSSHSVISRPRTPHVDSPIRQKSPDQESPPDSLLQVDPQMAQRGKHVAFALFLGILVDGVPEGLLMGFLAAEGHLSVVLVISLLVANFPEAFSSASLMRQANVSRLQIVSMWGGLCVMVGALAGFACFTLKYFFPTYPTGENLPQSLLVVVAVIEGITGGAMIACIATVMLPEAFTRAGKEGSLLASSGFLCTAGFLVAVVMKALEHHYNNTHGHPDIIGHAFYAPGYGYW